MLSTRRIVMLMLALIFFQEISAKGVYQTPEDFLTQAFGQAPEAQRVLIKGDLAKEIQGILGHRYKKIRVPYWQSGCRTAWILEEIGKEQYITTGFVVNSQGLEKVKVLVFRENRGWEVRHDFFSDQLTNAKLTEEHKLDKQVDNISGATLSVRAVTNISIMALLLHDHVTNGSC